MDSPCGREQHLALIVVAGANVVIDYCGVTRCLRLRQSQGPRLSQSQAAWPPGRARRWPDFVACARVDTKILLALVHARALLLVLFARRQSTWK